MAIEGMGKLTSEQLKQMHQNIQESPKQVEKAVKQKDDKQKLALALGALGAVGAAAVAVAMKAKKGKVADVADLAKDGADKLKKVATEVAEEAKDGTKKLSDIKFEKGIAKQGDNLFTGVIEDTLKSGKKVTLEYTDGKIQKSTIDNISKNYSYGEGLKKVNGKYFFYDQNGKIEKISERMGDGSVLRHKEFKNGELISQTKAHANGELIDGVIYAPNSKGKKAIKYFQENCITEYAEDGSMKTKYGSFDINKTPLNELDVKNPKQVVWKDKDGNCTKSLEIKDNLDVIEFWKKSTNDDITISSKKSMQDPNKTITYFSNHNSDITVKFEDDVITKTYGSGSRSNLKENVSELLELLKTEGFEFSNKIQTLFEKL